MNLYMHVNSWNIVVPLKNLDAQNFLQSSANFGHPVSKSWLIKTLTALHDYIVKNMLHPN